MERGVVANVTGMGGPRIGLNRTVNGHNVQEGSRDPSLGVVYQALGGWAWKISQ